ncbi:MAG: hypothetical protein ACTS2F_21115 [Thainema sp.]
MSQVAKFEPSTDAGIKCAIAKCLLQRTDRLWASAVIGPNQLNVISLQVFDCGPNPFPTGVDEILRELWQTRHCCNLAKHV